MFRDDIESDFHVDVQPKENEILLKCPICGKVYYKAEYDDEDGWDIDIERFDNDILKIKKIKLIVFMCYGCFDEREYSAEEYDEDGNFLIDILCYDKNMNLVHQSECCY